MRTLVWEGLGTPRMELARADVEGRTLHASGTQIGVAYELRYELSPELLRLELVGDRELELELGLEEFDFFDLGYSPLFNSLPVLRDGLLDGAAAREYRMRLVTVPDLELHESQQRYEPFGDRSIRFSSGSIVADLEFDADGFVVRYEGLAERIH